MHEYIVRRDHEFDELKKVSEETGLSKDIRAYLLLKFSGLSRNERAQVVASCGNEFVPEKFKQALRMQFPGQPRKRDYPMKTSEHRQTWAAETASDEIPDTEPENEQDESVDEPEVEEQYEDDFFGDIDFDDLNDQELDVLAAAVQLRGKARKGKGKGKGGGKGGSKVGPKGGSKGGSVMDRVQNEKASREHSQRINDLKARSKCLDCDQVGHWHGDPQCKKPGAGLGRKSNGNTKSSYFCVLDSFNNDAECFAVTKPTAGPCEHAIDRQRCVQRGANQHSSYIRCWTCSTIVCSFARTSVWGKWGRLVAAFWWTFLGKQADERLTSRERRRWDRLKDEMANGQDEDKEKVVIAKHTQQRFLDCSLCGQKPVDSTLDTFCIGCHLPACEDCRYVNLDGWTCLPCASIDTKQWCNYGASEPSDDEATGISHGAQDAASSSTQQRPEFPDTGSKYKGDATDVFDEDGDVIFHSDILCFGRFRNSTYYQLADSEDAGWYNDWVMKQNPRESCHQLSRYLRYLLWRCNTGLRVTTKMSPPNHVYRSSSNPPKIDHQRTAFMTQDYDGNGDDDSPGLAVVDTACQCTMHGPSWRRQYEAALLQRGMPGGAVLPARLKFKGIGGSATCNETIDWPVGISTCNGQLRSAQVQQDVPLLLSRSSLRALGAHIHLDSETIDLDKLGAKDVKLVRTSGGHLAINLLDFDGIHPGLDKKIETLTSTQDLPFTWRS